MQSKQLGATLSEELRKKYSKRSVRVIEGDTVRVLRGEFKGIDGKVTKILTEKNGVAIEGIKREKLKGGNVDIFIHASNLMVTGLNLDDKWRQNRLAKQKTKTIKEKPVEQTNVKQEKQTKTEESTITKPTKETKEKSKLPSKETKQTKAAKSVKKEKK